MIRQHLIKSGEPVIRRTEQVEGRDRGGNIIQRTNRIAQDESHAIFQSIGDIRVRREKEMLIVKERITRNGRSSMCTDKFPSAGEFFIGCSTAIQDRTEKHDQ